MPLCRMIPMLMNMPVMPCCAMKGVINEESDVTELTEKRRRRAPEKYSPTWFMDSDVIAFMQEVDAAKLVSEAASRFISVNPNSRY